MERRRSSATCGAHCGTLGVARSRTPARRRGGAGRQISLPQWNVEVDAAAAPGNAEWPTDAQVVGAVNRAAVPGDIVVCAAGGLPGELHKLWRSEAGGYHLEYGFSCMGYEIAGGLGVKLANPTREVFVMVGDGSYLMMNSELQTSVMLGSQADRDRARQWRFRLHRPTATRLRRCIVQQPDSEPAAPRWISSATREASARCPRRRAALPSWKPRWSEPGSPTAPR